jgi:biopolymer transport protein ExbB
MESNNLILFTIQNDWAVLMPILIASVGLVYLCLNRFFYYRDNERDMEGFVHRLQQDLSQDRLDNAYRLSGQLGGIIGKVSEEGLQLLAQQHSKEEFAGSFDITLNLALRRLEKGLDHLGTIGTIAPYLGLFGTVVRILITFGELSAKGGNASGAPEIMFGIGSALIATAFGLLVAILAVVANNTFRSVVARFENDFQLLKLVFLSYREGSAAMHHGQAAQAPSMHPQQPVAAGGGAPLGPMSARDPYPGVQRGF